ncbi:MAG: TnsD family Tn7-like transposition protein [Oryzomonas sp.]|uniref:TnsD family Tn7-like transposition protein n=1 Tax=Oryzomonas sp. TaxID=2855186 RepID=UPI00284F35D2|nr:TnsD family Tn7-like transposition protein [Oryzomonas sp.]MDR3579211.1 TnsD family Tn7-like transposition protein [Oryzomonas sp.]
MLPFFPSPYPDELFSGICSRYHQRSGHTSIGETLRDLFDNRLATVTTDFPMNIRLVSEKLSPASKNTLPHLINAHTLLPLYLPFLPESRAAKIIDLMTRKTTVGNFHMTIGATASAIRSIAFLRYCPACLRDDRMSRGEPYWHRSHQVPGVDVCHLHQGRLVASTAAAHGVGSKHDLIPLSGIAETCGSSSDGLHGLSHHAWLARSAHWLLNVTPPIQPQGLERLRHGYLLHLRRIGLAGASWRLEWHELIRQFLDFYGLEFLDEVHSPLALGSSDNWLLSMLHKPRKASHPLRHFLIIRFLDLEVEEFFHRAAELENRPGWYSKTVKWRLGDADTGDSKTDTKSLEEHSLYSRRESWLRACAFNPVAGVRGLRRIYGADYSWLYRHDREWLRSHSPHKPHPSNKVRVDWDERDASLASQVIAVAAEIKNSQGRPIQVTVRAIGIRLGATALFEKLMAHLPRTGTALATVVESRDEFASRRLRLAAERLGRQGEPVRAWELVRAAGLRPECVTRLAEEIGRLVA